MRLRGRFVPQSTIDRRMAGKDERIARETARRLAGLPSQEEQHVDREMAREAQEHQTFFKSQMTFRSQHKVAKRIADEAEKREAYRLVDVRDGGKCRACQRKCLRTTALVPNRLERHHYLFRSLGGKHDPSNLLTLCNSCHTEAQAHRLIITGHPDQTMTFSRHGRTWRG